MLFLNTHVMLQEPWDTRLNCPVSYPATHFMKKVRYSCFKLISIYYLRTCLSVLNDCSVYRRCSVANVIVLVSTNSSFSDVHMMMSVSENLPPFTSVGLLSVGIFHFRQIYLDFRASFLCGFGCYILLC